MSDSPANRGELDRSRINVNQDHELRYWMDALDGMSCVPRYAR